MKTEKISSIIIFIILLLGCSKNKEVPDFFIKTKSSALKLNEKSFYGDYDYKGVSSNHRLLSLRKDSSYSIVHVGSFISIENGFWKIKNDTLLELTRVNYKKEIERVDENKVIIDTISIDTTDIIRKFTFHNDTLIFLNPPEHWMTNYFLKMDWSHLKREKRFK